MNIIKHPLFKIFLGIGVLALLLVFARKHYAPLGCKQPGNDAQLFNPAPVSDSGLTGRIDEQISKDTSSGFLGIKKIYIDRVKPEIIYVNKIDTIRLREFIKQDLIFRTEKRGDRLIIQAVNIDGGVIKEFVYDNVQRDFIAISKPQGGMDIRTKKFYFNGVSLSGGYHFKNTDYKTGSPVIGLKTGWNYKDRLSIVPGASYDIKNKDYLVSLDMELKFIK